MNLNLIRAATLIYSASWRNRIRKQVQRLRQPRYLIATLAGAYYFWSVLGRFLFGGARGRWHAMPHEMLPLVELGLSFLAIVLVASSWVFGGDEGSLRFTEAETQFLFPAPVTRAALLHYRLGRALLGALISSLLMTLFTGHRLTPHWGFFWAGTWLALGTLSLHMIAASLARASLVEHGISGLKRQALSLVLFIGLGTVIWLWVGSDVEPFPDLSGPAQFAHLGPWAEHLMSRPPLGWALYPVLAPLRVVFAQSDQEFWAAMPGAFVVLLLHYLWAVRSNVAFEDASIEAAGRMAARMDALRSGRGIVIRKIRPPFRLRARGRPEVALLWKNVVGLVRAHSLRLVLVLFYLGATSLGLCWALFDDRADWKFVLATGLCVALAGYLSLLGPMIVRSDFRQDLPMMELLRTYPLGGRDAVQGQIAGPALVLALGQWVLLALGLLMSLGVREASFPPGERVAVALSASLVLPCLTLGSLLIQNAVALLFPTWVTTGRSRGIEAMGQRLVTLVGNLLMLGLGLAPASIVGGVVGLVLWEVAGLGTWGLPFGAAASALVLLIEVHFALDWLGEAFEQFDLTQ